MNDRLLKILNKALIALQRIKTPPKSIFSILRLNPFLRSASHTVSALPSKGLFSRGAL